MEAGPALILAFPHNRENNRECCKFSAILAVPDVNSRNNSSALQANPCYPRNREFSEREQGIQELNREFPCPGGARFRARRILPTMVPGPLRTSTSRWSARSVRFSMRLAMRYSVARGLRDDRFDACARRYRRDVTARKCPPRSCRDSGRARVINCLL